MWGEVLEENAEVFSEGGEKHNDPRYEELRVSLSEEERKAVQPVLGVVASAFQLLGRVRALEGENVSNIHKMQIDIEENRRTDKDRTELLSKQIAKLQADCRELVEHEKRSKDALLQVE